MYNEKEKMYIVCDELLLKTQRDNIIIMHDTYNDEYYRLLRNAKAVVIFLDNENISSGQLVILQAMQLKVPIVVSKSNALQDYVINNVNALIIDKSEVALAKALHKLKEEPELRKKLISNGYKLWKEKYSFKSLAEQVNKFL